MLLLPVFNVSRGGLRDWLDVRYSVNVAGLVIHSLIDSENFPSKGL